MMILRFVPCCAEQTAQASASTHTTTSLSRNPTLMSPSAPFTWFPPTDQSADRKTLLSLLPWLHSYSEHIFHAALGMSLCRRGSVPIRESTCSELLVSQHPGAGAGPPHVGCNRAFALRSARP